MLTKISLFLGFIEGFHS